MRLHRSQAALCAALVMASLGLAGCSGSDPDASASGDGSSAASGSGGSGVEDAVAAVEKYREGVPPTGDIPALQGIDQLRGKTVMYMPIALTVPFFQAAIHGLTDALEPVGATVQTCDAKANPSAAAACLDQAVKQDVAAVVTDAVPQAFAAQAFAAVQAAGIPLVTVNSGDGDSSATQAYVGGTGSTQADEPVGGWIIADSKGAANVLFLQIVDSPASIAYVEQGGIPEFADQCPGCTVTVVKSTTTYLPPRCPANFISTALVRDPDIGYVYAEFDTDLPAVVQGLQTSSAGAGVKVIGADRCPDLAPAHRLRPAPGRRHRRRKPGRLLGRRPSLALNVPGGAQGGRQRHPPHLRHDQHRLARAERRELGVERLLRRRRLP